MGFRCACRKYEHTLAWKKYCTYSAPWKSRVTSSGSYGALGKHALFARTVVQGKHTYDAKCLRFDRSSMYRGVRYFWVCASENMWSASRKYDTHYHPITSETLVPDPCPNCLLWYAVHANFNLQHQFKPDWLLFAEPKKMSLLRLGIWLKRCVKVWCLTYDGL